MNIELVPAAKLREAERLLARGDGESLRSGAMVLLLNKCPEDAPASSENCAPVLNSLLKKLTEDPYKCLGVSKSADSKEIKRAYRQLALKVHPDKNANKTSVLFAAVQGAYVVLNDDNKRKNYDMRCERREQQTDRLRKRKEQDEERKRRGHGSAGMGRTPSTNSFHIPPKSTADAKQRDFNRKFYNEYRAAAMQSRGGKPPPPPGPAPANEQQQQQPSAARQHEQQHKQQQHHHHHHKSAAHQRGSAAHSTKDDAAAAAASGGGDPGTATTGNLAPPPKPVGLRMTSKTDTTVTLEWRAGGGGGGGVGSQQCAASKAYELQWRIRTESGKPRTWETGQQLILRSTCRKRNLRPGSCYEFRVRAASISGWSPHSDSLMVVTLCEPVAAEHETTGASGDNKRSSGCGANSHGRGAGRSSSSSSSAHPGVELPRVPNNHHQQPTSSGTTSRSSGASAGSSSTWQCVVCKRPNTAAAAKCAVCGTRKDYDWHGASAANPPSGSGGQRTTHSSGRRDTADKDEEDYGIDGADPLGGTWQFSEKDVPEKYNAYDDIDQWMDEPPVSPGAHHSGAKPDSLWLNPAVTCLHNVRREPIRDSAVVGHLVADTEIHVVAETGNWIKCKYHKPYRPHNGAAAAASGATGGEGWCLKYDDDHQYIVKDGFAYPSRRSSEDGEEEVIYELRDDDNRLYYFNSFTGVSMWDPPEWVDEIDPTSGAVYYTHSKTGETQWERPFDFVPIVREELYSTPQAKFIKSILSPKRSNHNLAGI